MSEPFDTRLSLVVVRGFVTGPRGRVGCRLAVDTAASGTLLSQQLLRAAGYDTTRLILPLNMHTAGGVRQAGRLRIERLNSLGLSASNLLVVCHTVTATTSIDGLLGLDFLRGRVLTLDFARGRIALRSPRRWWAFWR